MKIYINSAKENWVVDRFISEWNQYNQKQTKNYYFGKKIIWLIAPWTWKKVPKRQLIRNKVLCTIHHIDEDKFDSKEMEDFLDRDKFVDLYHAISENTYKQIRKITSKPIVKIPFWVNQNIWYHINDKLKLREKYNLPKDAYIVGSFQREIQKVTTLKVQN